MKNEYDIQFNFEKLLVYQKSLDFVDLVYGVAKSFPAHEQFNLTSQLRRAANSIPLNLGEGRGGTAKEFAQFIRISFRSLYECVVSSTIAKRQGYIKTETDRQIREKAMEIVKMLSGLKGSLPAK